MSDKETGGMAFPMYFSDAIQPQGGMTLRDYFAAKAVVGLLDSSAGDYDWLAKQAYAAADAMLKERAK